MLGPDNRFPVAGIVLAAGAGTRMGANKMRLILDGEPLVRRAARMAMIAGVEPLVVVVGFEADLVAADVRGLGCEIVENPDYTGPSSASLHVGLNQLPDETEAVLVLLGDMPYTTGYMTSKVVEVAATDPAPLVVSRYGNVTAPPLLFRRQLFPELLAWTGEGCGKAVVRAHADEALYLDWPAPYLGDIETPEDYQRARNWVREVARGRRT